MANNKHITDDEFITGLGELVKLRAAQQPEKVKELREKYPEGLGKDLTKAEIIHKILDILDTLGVIPPEQDPKQEGEICNE